MKILSFLAVLLVMLMVPMASAIDENVGKEDSTLVGGHLIIVDVDVRVDGKNDKNLEDGDTIDEEAKPGSTVEFTIELANNFTRADDVEIEDIEVQVTIEEIDDDDDLEEESKEFDIKENDDKKIRIKFEIPLEVDEGDFTVLIEADGSTDDNGSQEVTMELELEVEKEDDEVRFLRNSITPSEIKCGRTVQLSTSVINTGSDEQDDVILEISNVDLGVNFRETFDLTDDPFDDDSKFRKTFTFTIPQEVEPGIYSILSTVLFDDGGDTERDSAELIVAQCEIFKVEEEEEEEEEEIVVVVPPPVTPPTTPTDVVTGGVIVSAPTLPVDEEESFFESTSFLVALVIGEVLLVLIAILLIAAVFRKRRD